MVAGVAGQDGLYFFMLQPLIEQALREDLSCGGDLTCRTLIDPELRIQAQLVVRKKGVIAGLDIAAWVYYLLDPAIMFTPHITDGASCEAGQRIATIEGPAHILLTGERVALNFLTHLSGIASYTKCFVDAIDGYECQIACTRKTTPGLRSLEKYAVRKGGGYNHRFGLGEVIMIKDNHLAFAGLDITQAIQMARQKSGHTVHINMECDHIDQAKQAIDAGADTVLLDNMSLADMKEIVAYNNQKSRRVTLEASGGINLETIQPVAQTGVDVISVGALTHSAPQLDIGLDYK